MNELNTNLFFLINYLPHPAWANSVAVILHLATYGGLIYYPLFLLFYMFGNSIAKRTIKLSAVSMVITYVITDLILKNIVHTQRPYQLLKDAVYLSPAPQSYSFPSGQAATAFALAFMVYFFAPNKKWSYLAFFWALIISLDRVYMGHHFPVDVVAGGVIGMIVSGLVYRYSQK